MAGSRSAINWQASRTAVVGDRHRLDRLTAPHGNTLPRHNGLHATIQPADDVRRNLRASDEFLHDGIGHVVQRKIQFRSVRHLERKSTGTPARGLDEDGKVGVAICPPGQVTRTSVSPTAGGKKTERQTICRRRSRPPAVHHCQARSGSLNLTAVPSQDRYFRIDQGQQQRHLVLLANALHDRCETLGVSQRGTRQAHPPPERRAPANRHRCRSVSQPPILAGKGIAKCADQFHTASDATEQDIQGGLCSRKGFAVNVAAPREVAEADHSGLDEGHKKAAVLMHRRCYFSATRRISGRAAVFATHLFAANQTDHSQQGQTQQREGPGSGIESSQSERIRTSPENPAKHACR